LCGARVGKAAMARHLVRCLEANRDGVRGRVVILRAYQTGSPTFWLHVAARREAKLAELDQLLRVVWLECCGHLSEFYDHRREALNMKSRVDDVLGAVGSQLGYVYDFGSSTELAISHVAAIDAVVPKKPRVIARNQVPTWPCDVCDEPATLVCADCSNDGSGFCCEKHAVKHACGEDMLLPVVNSPRMGVCGYTGGVV
jgi:hypothetical protein